MKRKGISPLIAAVLLIAFTMAVASLFAQWAPRLMNQATGDTSNRTAQLQDCSRYAIDIDFANDTHARVVQNRGPDGIGDIIVRWNYEGQAPKINRSGTIGQIQGTSTVTSNTTGTLEEVIATSSACQTVQSSYP